MIKLKRLRTLLVGTATASVLAFGAAAPPAGAVPAPSIAPSQVSGQSAAAQATSFRTVTVMPTASKTERRLTKKTKRVHRALRKKFPKIKRVLGYRPAQSGEHGKGRALDVMIPKWRSAKGKALGRQVARWAKNRAGSLKIWYVIYNQRIWNIQRKGDGWRKMRNAGNATGNHKNHVHISVRR